MNLSVAMCTYNGARYVYEQLDSIAAQTRLPDELVVCDDASSDDTIKIVKAFAATASFPVCLEINNVNLGSTKNFEKAIRLCSGDFIALADQDDVWCAEKLAHMEAAFTKSPDAGAVFTDAEIVDENLRPLGCRMWECIRFTADERSQIAKGKSGEMFLTRSLNPVTGATMAFRSKYKDLVLPIPSGIDLIHDGWIALMIALVAPLSLIDEPLIKYRQHPKQQLGTKIPSEKPVNAGDVLTKARRKNEHLNEIRRLETVCERLAIRKDFPVLPVVLAKIESRLMHIRTRAYMPERKLSRVPLVLRELFSLRYHTYSSGIYSAAKDLLF